MIARQMVPLIGGCSSPYFATYVANPFRGDMASFEIDAKNPLNIDIDGYHCVHQLFEDVYPWLPFASQDVWGGLQIIPEKEVDDLVKRYGMYKAPWVYCKTHGLKGIVELQYDEPNRTDVPLIVWKANDLPL